MPNQASLPDLSGWTIVFDLDGVLVDSAPDLVGAANMLLAEEGLGEVPLADGRLFVGRGARWLLEQCLAHAGGPTDAACLDAWLPRLLKHYRGRLTELSALYDGCVAALDDLRTQGATLAVCTNKRTEFSVPLLEALGVADRFVSIVGADQAPAPKPDPRHLLLAIEQAGGDPRRAVLVGDTDNDAEAARAAGVACILCRFGYSHLPIETLPAAGVIDHFGDLSAAVAACTAPAVSL